MSDAKVALSTRDSVDFRFQREGIDIGATVTRDDFEAWIADDIARLGATVDEVLAKAGITAHDVQKVFLTGGTSFVPAVQRSVRRALRRGTAHIGRSVRIHRLRPRLDRPHAGPRPLDGRGGGLTEETSLSIIQITVSWLH